MKYFFCLIFFLTGCSFQDRGNVSKTADDAGIDEVTKDTRIKGIEPELLPYVRSFEAAYGKSIGNITVNFGDTGDKKLTGVCNIRLDGRREVLISSFWWEIFKSKTPVINEPLVWHELGHCVLSRNHSSAKMPVNTPEGEREGPASVMYPTAAWYYFSEYRAYYIGELFRRSLMVDDENIEEEGVDGEGLHENDGCVTFE